MPSPAGNATRLPLVSQLDPSAVEHLKLPDGRVIAVPKATPTFRPWTGSPLGSTYGGKAVLDAAGEPCFAEIAILRELKREGWEGVWIDTYRNRMWRDSKRERPVTELPACPRSVLDRVRAARGGKRAGTWDVLAWRGDDLRFAEAKRAARDKIRPSQVEWLAAALGVGVRLDQLLVVEWSLAEATG